MSIPRLHLSITLFVLLTLVLNPRPGLAAAIDPPQYTRDDLLAAVNGLRAAHGLAPYAVSDYLMALAQEHSEYQASIHQSTHGHKDGRNPPQLGVVENVAGGDIGWIDAQIAVYEIWADPGHMRTMTGFSGGSMGVGIADDGVTAYYTLEVIPAGTPVPTAAVPGADPPSAEADPPPAQDTLIPITDRATARATATALPDGSRYHVVAAGDTLWSIAAAYGVTLDQLRAWNNFAPDGSNIYVGQKILVHPASFAPTPAGTDATSGADAAPGATAAAQTASPPSGDAANPSTTRSRTAAARTATARSRTATARSRTATSQTAASLQPGSADSTAMPPTAQTPSAPWTSIAVWTGLITFVLVAVMVVGLVQRKRF